MNTNSFSFKQAVCFEYIVHCINPSLKIVWSLNDRPVTFQLLPEDKQGNKKVYFTYSEDGDFCFANNVELLAKTQQKYLRSGGIDSFTKKIIFINQPDMLLTKICKFIQSDATDIESTEFDVYPTFYELKDLFSNLKLPFRTYLKSDCLEPISLLKPSQN